MRGVLAVSLLAMLAASGCASRETMRALQAPQPLPRGVITFQDTHPLRDAVAIEWIGGMSRHSYIFAEPNQNVFRPVLQAALENSALAAGTNVRARYWLRVDVAEAHGPSVGGHFQSEMVANYVVMDRAAGSELWRREIRSPGAGQFLSYNEEDWRTAWFVDPFTAAIALGYPGNYFPFASDSRAENARRSGDLAAAEARQRLTNSAFGDALADRWGRTRAARANYAAAAANVSAFLVAFAADNGVAITPMLPCEGSPEIEALKQDILASGGNFTTDSCTRER